MAVHPNSATGRWETVRESVPDPASAFPGHSGGTVMLRLALLFLVVALIAAFFGFGGIAAASAGIAKTLFYIFLVIFVVPLVMGLLAGRRTGL